VPFDTSKSRFNANPCDGDAVGLRVDAIPKEGVTRCENGESLFLLKIETPLGLQIGDGLGEKNKTNGPIGLHGGREVGDGL
jgi:hypothetical protein